VQTRYLQNNDVLFQPNFLMKVVSVKFVYTSTHPFLLLYLANAISSRWRKSINNVLYGSFFLAMNFFGCAKRKKNPLNYWSHKAHEEFSLTFWFETRCKHKTQWKRKLCYALWASHNAKVFPLLPLAFMCQGCCLSPWASPLFLHYASIIIINFTACNYQVPPDRR
jgi:hypothetical protein